MIHYYIIRDGFVISEGSCLESDLKNIDTLGGQIVFETNLPRATIDADNSARIKRSELLAESDWTQLPDVSIETKNQWAIYRQALRDITSQPGYPFDVIWPTKPE